MNTKKTEFVINEIYRRLFANSSPKADWDTLLREAELNEEGAKMIEYYNYSIDKGLYDKILDDVIKEYNVKPKRIANSLRNTIHLGCSPKFT